MKNPLFTLLDGGNSHIFLFSPVFGEGRFPFLTNIFQMGWFNHQPVVDLLIVGDDDSI